ncbi:hypothetical protein D5S17_35225 [Pseudonocardiaceae bacterium YIM PH 21723]|nr:hypothetical protein D5S17_35225 [Pseudonocardiaceae bacterium YIM PH 21723]
MSSIVVALLLIAGCALVATEAFQLLNGQRPLVEYGLMASWLHGTTWNSPRVLIAAGGLGVVGLWLLLKAVLPGKALILPLVSEEQVSAGVTRRGYANALQAAAVVPTADSAQVTVSRRRVRAVVKSSLGTPDTVAEDVRTAVTERLATIHPLRAPRVSVKVKEQA